MSGSVELGSFVIRKCAHGITARSKHAGLVFIGEVDWMRKRGNDVKHLMGDSETWFVCVSAMCSEDE